MKINLSDPEAVDRLLAQVNGRASAHTATWGTLVEVASDAEKWLTARHVPIADRKGVRVEWTTAGPGKAYARKARAVAGNTGTLVRGTESWFLTRLERKVVWAANPARFALHLPPAAVEAVKRFAFTDATPIVET